MAFLSDLTGGIIGDLGISGSSIIQGLGKFVTFIIIVLIVGALLGAYLYLTKMKKVYNKKIHIFEEINGRFIPSEDDTAMEFLIPNTHIKVFYLKRKKLYLPIGTRQMGKNHYWYGIGKNGEWINFDLTNLNKKMKEVELDFDHRDMRFANTQLKKLIEKNYKKSKWWSEWKNEIAVIILIIMLTFSSWFILGKQSEILSANRDTIQVSQQVLATSERLFDKIERYEGSSGIKGIGGTNG